MSNNAPDYNDNLAFPPQGDWSDTQPKNNTDRTQSSCDMVDKIEKLSKQLRIATIALSSINNYAPACFRTEECPLEGGYGFDNGCFRCGYATAWEALQKIKELNK